MTYTKPQTAADGLRLLADWFDATYQDAGNNDEVQQDLRKWANEFEELTQSLGVKYDTDGNNTYVW